MCIIIIIRSLHNVGYTKNNAHKKETNMLDTGT